MDFKQKTATTAIVAASNQYQSKLKSVQLHLQKIDIRVERGQANFSGQLTQKTLV